MFLNIYVGVIDALIRAWSASLHAVTLFPTRSYKNWNDRKNIKVEGYPNTFSKKQNKTQCKIFRRILSYGL